MHWMQYTLLKAHSVTEEEAAIIIQEQADSFNKDLAKALVRDWGCYESFGIKEPVRLSEPLPLEDAAAIAYERFHKRN